MGVDPQHLVPSALAALIDFRYHIISLVAVFLALALGMLIGAGLLDRVTVSTLEGRVKSLSGDLDRARADIAEIRTERDRSNDLVAGLAPRVRTDALLGSQVVFVRFGDAENWEGIVRNALKSAGAEDAGTLVFTERWRVPSSADRDKLGAILLAKLDPVNASADAAQHLGEQISTDIAPGLVKTLKDSGFVQTAAPAGTTFPPAGANIVVFAAQTDPWLASFAAAAANHTGTLVVASSPAHLGTVDVVRHLSGRPIQLSTFDSAEADPSGVGSVLALRAAIDQKGGNFGAAGGVRFFPPL